MSRSRLAAVTAGVAALASFVAAAPATTAHAAGTPVSRAADYIVATYKPVQDGDAGSDIDALLGLAAGGAPYAAAAKVAYTTAMADCGSPEAAPGSVYGTAGTARTSKCALAAETVGDIALAKRYLATITGADFSQEYEFGVGLDATAFERAGLALPPTLEARMVELTTPTKAGDVNSIPLMQPYGAQYDAAGVIFAAFLKLPSKTAAQSSSQKTLEQYLAKGQQADGSWPDYNPVNTTGMVAPAFGLVDPANQERGKAFVTSQQLSDGSLPNGGQADLRATEQGIFALANTTLFDLAITLSGNSTPPSTPAPTPTPSAAVVKATSASDCARKGGVWTVVENRSTTERAGCIKLTGGATALAALKALTPNVTTQTSTYGDMICTIDGIGMGADKSCGYDPSTKLFWGFYTATGVGTAYDFAQVGAGSYTPAPGSAVAFNWGDNVTAPTASAPTDQPIPTVSTPAPAPSTTPSNLASTPSNTASTPSDPASTPGKTAVPTGSAMPTTPVETQPSTQTPGLANTGSGVSSLSLGIGLLMLVAGATATTARRR